MLEGRVQAYKRELVEGAEPHIGAGERVRVLAMAQGRVGPFVQFIPMAAGIALATGGLFGDTYLPGWAGAVGVLIALAGVAFTTYGVPRRILLPTDARLYVFELPRSGKAAIEEPLAVYEVSELPTGPAEDGPPTLGGERLWPNYGAGGEREAIAAALDPAPIG